MKKMTLIFISVFFALNLIAQEDAETNDNQLSMMMRNKQYSEALSYMSELELTPLIRFQKVICYKGLGNYNDAIQILQSLAKEDSSNIRYISELADCYTTINSWEKSADCYRNLCKLDTTNIYFELQEAIMLSRLGKYTKALPIYSNLQTKYNLKSVYKYKAECFDKLRILDSAAYYYDKAWKNNELDVSLLASYVTIVIREKNIDLAIEITDNFIRKDTTNLSINRLNAISYYATNFMYKQAAQKFERCYNMGDSSLQVSRGLGMSYYTLDSLEKAYPHLLRAYKYDTTSINITFPLADVCHLLEKEEEAAKYYNQLLEQLIPKLPVLRICYKNLAEAYENSGMYDDALNNYQELLKLTADPVSQMNLYYTIGHMCDEKAQKYNDAIFYYEKYKESLLSQKKIDEIGLKKISNSISQTKELADKKHNLEHLISQMKERINNLDLHINKLKKIAHTEFENTTPTMSIYSKDAIIKPDSITMNVR